MVMAAELVYVSLFQRRGIFWSCCQVSTADGEMLPLPRRVCAGVAQATPVLLWAYLASAATLVILALTGLSYTIALYVLTICSLGIAIWRVVGGDGASQMTLIVLTACTLGSLSGGPRGAAASLWFVGLQGLLAYFVAGVAKLISPEWRNEDIVSKIASSASYGNETAAQAVAVVPGLGRTLTLSVIVFEIAMPLAIVMPLQQTMWFLGIAISFHLGCAFVMGLNDFVWAFMATFPSILYISTQVNGVLR